MECERLILLLMFEYFYVSERGRELSDPVSGHLVTDGGRLEICYRFPLDGGSPGPAGVSVCDLNV